MLDPTSLTLGEKNDWHNHPLEQLALYGKIILETGWRRPIVVSKRSGQVVKGNGATLTAIAQGWTKVPVEFQAYDTDEQELADMIADNKLAELAGTDEAKLRKLLAALDGKIDLHIAGLTDAEIAALHLTDAAAAASGGYKAGEVASAMQKCIRRGLADDALFWATELDFANFGEYVWKRLRIIASEDIGLSVPGLAGDVRALYENWLDQRRKKDSIHAPERLFLVHAVLILARAHKSRLVDHALIVHYEGKRPPREIPDFALDKHTARGRARRRGWKHFWKEGATLSPAAPIEDPYEPHAQQIRQDRQHELDL